MSSPVTSHDVREERGWSIVSLRGDVDLETSPEVRRLLLEQVGAGGPVLVDMAGVSYIDSSGIASLVEAFQTARRAGSDFGLACVSEAALRVLRLARLDTVFAIHETVREALGDGV